MRFLITNDDGFYAPGLLALYRALRPLGEVIVVAPETCHSSKGHAVDTKSKIRVERRQVEGMDNIHVVHSTPADCVRVGLRHILKTPPDFVIAGINPGANLGVDLFYSGTAAAAREAALLGVPSLALSRYLNEDAPIDWETLSLHACRVVRTLISHEFPLPALHFWNVNFPAIGKAPYPEQISFVPHGVEPHAVGFQVVETSENAELLAYSAVYRDRGRSANCDVKHLFDQRITATLVGPQMTGPVSHDFPHLPQHSAIYQHAADIPV
jgi:5'-nucleotidase